MKYKKGQGVIITMSIMAIILVVVLGVIFSFVSGITNTQSVNNETLAFTSLTTVVSNETLAFLNVSATVENETVTLNETGNDSAGPSVGNLSNREILVITEIRNETSEIITGFCNITQSTGAVQCNATGSTTMFVNYTFAESLTSTLGNGDLTTLTALRNITSENIINFCNITLSTGALVCNQTFGTGVGFADYTHTSGRTDTLANDDLTAQPTFRNGTSGALGVNDCNATLATGVVICNNIHSATGFADYNYNPEGFVTSGTTRTLVNLITVLLAIAILIFIVGFVTLRR